MGVISSQLKYYSSHLLWRVASIPWVSFPRWSHTKYLVHRNNSNGTTPLYSVHQSHTQHFIIHDTYTLAIQYNSREAKRLFWQEFSYTTPKLHTKSHHQLFRISSICISDEINSSVPELNNFLFHELQASCLSFSWCLSSTSPRYYYIQSPTHTFFHSHVNLKFMYT